MNKYIIMFLIIFFLVILLRNYNENFPYYFNTYNLYDRRYCKNCNSRSILNCGECFNCGICIKDNISSCESGDIDESEKKQCDKWIYNSDIFINYNPYYYNSQYNPYYYNSYYNPYYNPYYYGYYRYYDYPYYRIKNKYNKQKKIKL